jgi:ribosome-binding protein aMBF1 (putative translation factor)
MDVLEADLLKEIDPAELGQRIRAARVAKGWTQTQLAGDDISVGYVSRIESGQRRPNSRRSKTWPCASASRPSICCAA